MRTSFPGPSQAPAQAESPKTRLGFAVSRSNSLQTVPAPVASTSEPRATTRWQPHLVSALAHHTPVKKDVAPSAQPSGSQMGTLPNYSAVSHWPSRPVQTPSRAAMSGTSAPAATQGQGTRAKVQVAHSVLLSAQRTRMAQRCRVNVMIAIGLYWLTSTIFYESVRADVISLLPSAKPIINATSWLVTLLLTWNILEATWLLARASPGFLLAAPRTGYALIDVPLAPQQRAVPGSAAPRLERGSIGFPVARSSPQTRPSAPEPDFTCFKRFPSNNSTPNRNGASVQTPTSGRPSSGSPMSEFRQVLATASSPASRSGTPNSLSRSTSTNVNPNDPSGRISAFLSRHPSPQQSPYREPRRAEPAL
ncbi:uncharacterized protein L969DRAFT_19943 [Mixia osmundae IAM 14324]|uniref:Nucleoporin POM34 n=1 Tax=Mixia osmundae (strain CBS 9802 / IAM 14324 / JCM 22182 / KY 12970) TaxID=764103 RepID=G7E2L7_MIXOS|nr:uncharacterized protein L969DRAFT_19943 [Mixia osmundae IAM 14324]KEI36943.1 hypothetical protein L969DRAFT_19943 [Mixia osmundae IAM 14324]GAA97077.1 hypothetical protein E5Q_03752 [Mixia osmundae IAM 14324]